MINLITVGIIVVLIILNIAVLTKSDEIQKPRHKVVYAGITFVLTALLITNIVLFCFGYMFSLVFLIIEYIALCLLEISMITTVRPDLTKTVLIAIVIISARLFGFSMLYNYIDITVEDVECIGFCEKDTGFKETTCKLYRKVNNVFVESKWYCKANYGMISNGVSVTSDTVPQNFTYNE